MNENLNVKILESYVEIDKIHDSNENDEILLNVSSGTPAMKGALILISNLLPDSYHLKQYRSVLPVRLSEKKKQSIKKIRKKFWSKSKITLILNQMLSIALILNLNQPYTRKLSKRIFAHILMPTITRRHCDRLKKSKNTTAEYPREQSNSLKRQTHD